MFTLITLYTALVISLGLFKNSILFTKVGTMGALLSAILMCSNILRWDRKHRLRNILFELSYILFIYGVVNHLSDSIGNVFSSLPVIGIYVIYIVYINPKYMNRIMY